MSGDPGTSILEQFGETSEEAPECVEDPALPQHQRLRQKYNVLLSDQEVDDAAGLCLQVVRDYEAQITNVVAAALTGCVSQSEEGIREASHAADDASPTFEKQASRNAPVKAEQSPRSGLTGSNPFGLYASFRPAFSQRPCGGGEAPGDNETLPCSDDVSSKKTPSFVRNY